jgi:hypothetical protein
MFTAYSEPLSTSFTVPITEEEGIQWGPLQILLNASLNTLTP